MGKYTFNFKVCKLTKRSHKMEWNVERRYKKNILRKLPASVISKRDYASN